MTRPDAHGPVAFDGSPAGGEMSVGVTPVDCVGDNAVGIGSGVGEASGGRVDEGEGMAVGKACTTGVHKARVGMVVRVGETPAGADSAIV